jgi:hypothetical protein
MSDINAIVARLHTLKPIDGLRPAQPLKENGQRGDACAALRRAANIKAPG